MLCKRNGRASRRAWLSKRHHETVFLEICTHSTIEAAPLEYNGAAAKLDEPGETAQQHDSVLLQKLATRKVEDDPQSAFPSELCLYFMENFEHPVKVPRIRV
jgi:hypothetical protein